jgi:flagellar biosynthetic protein FliR
VNVALLNVLAPHGWPLFALLTARVLGVVIIAPLWSSATIPTQIRVMLVLGISFALAPGVPGGTAPEATLLLPIAAGGEFLLGLAIGFTASLFLNAVVIAGDIIAVQMGLSIASVYDPNAGAQVTEVGQLTTNTAIAMYAVLGGPLILVGTLHDTLTSIPLGTVSQFEAAARAILPEAGVLFVAAIRLAAPVMASLFLANVGLAILTRAVPQISAFMVAFPATIGLGFVVLAASLPGRGAMIHEWIENLPRLLDHTIGAFVVPAVVR